MSRIISASLLLFLTACGGDDTGMALTEPTFDTLPGGLIRVTNHGPSAWADTSGWRIVPDYVIAPDEGSPGALSGYNQLVVDEAGYAYVMQRSPVRIAVFGPDGEWLRDIGREGDGPGEFRDGMLGLVGDTLFVQDPNNTRLTTFLTDGTPIASHNSQCCYFNSRISVLADGRALIPGPPPSGEGGGALYLTHMNGTVTDTMLLPTTDFENDDDYWTVARRSGQSSSIRVVNVPFRPINFSTVRPDGRVISGRSDSYQLVIGSNYADTARIISATAPTVSVTDAQRDSAYRAVLDGMNDEWRDAFEETADLGDLPNSWPLWTAMGVDRDNNIWVSLPGDRGGHTTLQVFNPDGVLLGNVPGVGVNLFNGYWTRDRIYVVDEDEMGLPIIRVFRIVKT